MSEPKKETVRIVLPPRREGQPLASTPRESAMINLPPKPVPAPPSAPAVPPPSSVSAPSVPPPSIPTPPSNLQPPSAPGIPKPPSFPGVAPKPPGAPAVPKPVSVPSSAEVAPAVPKPASVGPAPVAVKPQAKKETAKVASTPGLAPKPQATVRLQPRPAPSQAASATFKVQSSQIAPVAETLEEEEIPMNLAVAALVTAAIALLVQVWFMI